MFGTLDLFLWFIITISIIVFVHELGHYLPAKLFGVKVEQFSLGFGKEIIGFNDKSGTRWKLSLIPMGGYVKMFGDANPASAPDFAKLNITSEKEAESAFFFKPLWQKTIIVFSGPLFNFLFAIAIIMGMLLKFGYVHVEPVVSEVVEDSPAYKAGIKPGDRVEMIDGKRIESFAELQSIVSMNLNPKLEFQIKRGEELRIIDVYPKRLEKIDEVGYEQHTSFIGIAAKDIKKVDVSVAKAFEISVHRVIEISQIMLEGLWQLVSGQRSVEDIGGPIKIAKYSKHSVDEGYYHLLSFIALLSINLGILNLLPIPMLDGGHLMFYAIETLFMRKMPQLFYEVAMRLGFAVIIFMMMVAVLNDLRFLVS